MRFFEDKDLKKITYLFISVIIIAVLIFIVIFLVYKNALTNEIELSSLNTIYNNKVSNLINKNTAEVSFSEDKDISNKVVTEENNLNKNIENIAI